MAPEQCWCGEVENEVDVNDGQGRGRFGCEWEVEVRKGLLDERAQVQVEWKQDGLGKPR